VASLGLLIAWTVVRLCSRRPEPLYRRAALWTHRWVRTLRAIAGFEVTTKGPLPAPGSLLAPNHIGYVDVFAVGSVLPCFFVAKVDVESWPFIGTLFRSSQCIGVPRSRVKALVEVTRRVADRLKLGHSVVVFLEGTSTGGDWLRPFYPPLAQPAIDANAPLTPVAIRWSTASGAVDIAENIAYWKDHTFATHAWRLMGLRGIRAEIAFGEPISPAGHTRKSLAAAAERAVAAMTGLNVDAGLQ
jgi:1-acyl-sn-glycerol-3-phosphate acyltransferase